MFYKINVLNDFEVFKSISFIENLRATASGPMAHLLHTYARTNQLMCSTNQLRDFYVMETLILIIA